MEYFVCLYIKYFNVLKHKTEAVVYRPCTFNNIIKFSIPHFPTTFTLSPSISLDDLMIVVSVCW